MGKEAAPGEHPPKGATDDVIWRQLPAVSSLLNTEKGRALVQEFSHHQVVSAIRHTLAQIRQELRSRVEAFPPSAAVILEQATAFLRRQQQRSLRRVINATGIIIHTNLGRSSLAEEARQAIFEIAGGYSNLEYDLESGERGSRQGHVEELLCRLTGAEAALVVNNNAAAVLLALQTVAAGREVIVSRGQLVEIGGSFRIPEVMAASGAILVEVGTTNKTKLADYSRAINERTAVLLMVHPSNYRITGFTASVSLEELISLGQQKGLPVMFDAGSGYLLDLGVEALAAEPVVQKAIQSGAALVTFSGDKLLGGPQAGIILGRRELIARMRSNPLARALRIDKLSLAALEATLRLYLDPMTARTRIPTWRRLTLPMEEIERRAKALTEMLQRVQPELAISIEPQESQAGGGSLPEEGLPTLAVTIRHPLLSAEGLARRLRQNDPPIIVRVAHQQVLLDPRTLEAEEFSFIAEALSKIGGGQKAE